ARILSPAALAPLDFHASPLGRAPLAAERMVVYGLGLPGPQVDAEGTVLVVADPQGNLPEARAEARAVLAAVPDAHLLQGFEATGAGLRAGLAHAALLHYAGHGREHGGWGSELPLADGAALRVGDILALPRVPARVVLSGCETGAAAGEHGVGLGLAQAFILAGARGVVAATRPVPDATARALMEALYAEDPSDLVVALHRAQARLRAHDPEADWAAFRIFVP
ncbi:MAG: CHAT domain-containing protein, partial [Myxococcales bacterium]|nr:CHAT domain-containing protein [Myxococcales bacterium]